MEKTTPALGRELPSLSAMYSNQSLHIVIYSDQSYHEFNLIGEQKLRTFSDEL